MPAPGHSQLAPSSAFRWTKCTASISFIDLNADVLSFESSEQADEGTRAHALLTAILKKTLGQVADNAEMQAIIDEMVAWIYSLMQPDDRLLVDQKVSLFYLPTERGTLDVMIVGPHRIICIDLKYGKGVSVYAQENKQLAIYAESKLRELEMLDTLPPELPVHLIIYQPRDRNDPQVVREWVTTRRLLGLFCATEIAPAAKTILSGGHTEFCPGEPCKFCPATGICKAYATQGLQALSVIDDAPVDAILANPISHVIDVSLISRDKRQLILAHKQDMIAFLEAVEDQELHDLLSGAAPLQFKLVEGKTNRQWRDEKKTAAFLAQHNVPIDGIYPPAPPVIVTPAQAEKALKAAGVKLTAEFKAELAGYTEKPKGKATLVPISDPRPTLLLNSTTGLSEIHETDASAFI